MTRGTIVDMSYILANYDALLTGLVATITLASIITKLTPTPKDDKVLDQIKLIIGRLGIYKFDGSKKIPGKSAE